MGYLPQDSSKLVLYFEDMDNIKQQNEHRQGCAHDESDIP